MILRCIETTMKNQNTKSCSLTPREVQIVILIGRNKKYHEIAEELGLGYETIKTYSRRIRKKLSLTSKLAIGIWAYSQGLLK